MDFFSEGGFSGRICEQTGQSNELVDGVRLRDFLDSRVDFLKLDIEGAEVEVINDCQDRLHNIEHLFVEYHSPLGQKQQLDIILTALTNSAVGNICREGIKTLMIILMRVLVIS